jgi:hypothetical protein
MLMRLRSHVPSLIAVAVAATVLIGHPTSVAATSPQIPEAHHVGPIRSLGPLFLAGLQQPHTCSASVVLSPSRDLVLTAAHCITGTGAGIQFVPGYHDGETPYGVWTAAQVYVDPSWTSRQDAQHDVAILKMQRQQRDGRSVGVEDVVGGNVLGFAPPNGTRVSVPAYPVGIDDNPINCRNTIYRTDGYPSFDCHYYFDGTSGAPFLQSIGGRHGQVVVGVIGGLHQGGCVDYTSYSSPFGPDTYRLWIRATLGLGPDVLPPPGSPGC